MRRSLPFCAIVLGLAMTAPVAFAAEGDAPRAAGPVWGTVVKVSDDAVTVQPEFSAKAKVKPAERTFALPKDQTEYLFAEVGMRRLMNDGTSLRTLTDPEPATAADLKVGQLVEVTPAKADAAAAARLIIAWSVAGTIVKVTGDAITFRPAADPGHTTNAAADAPKPDDADDAADDRELTLSKEATTVRIKKITDVRPSGRRGFTASFEYRPATLADLKAGQSVDVCIRGDKAVKITIHEK